MTTHQQVEGLAPATTRVYDDLTVPGYDLAAYAAKWANPYGLGELEVGGARVFDADGMQVTATPFRTSSDESVLDHLKYMAVSTETFPVPVRGSVQVTATIAARTPGAEGGRVVRGVFAQSGEAYAAQTLEGQQAAAVLNVVDFATGQLFDWFVAGSTAFALIERLPSVVTGSPAEPESPGWVGLDKMYTQIVQEFPVQPGPHEVSIRFTRDETTGQADWFLDGELVAHVEHVGVPLDQQGVPYAGSYPSLGPGEEIAPRIDNVTIGHGVFSVLDAFPFQHPDAPELAVHMPAEERVFGQGAIATFADFRIETITG